MKLIPLALTLFGFLLAACQSARIHEGDRSPPSSPASSDPSPRLERVRRMQQAFTTLERMRFKDLNALFSAAPFADFPRAGARLTYLGKPLLLSPSHSMAAFSRTLWGDRMWEPKTGELELKLRLHGNRLRMKPARANVRGRLNLYEPTVRTVDGKEDFTLDDREALVGDYAKSPSLLVQSIVEDFRPITLEGADGLWLGRTFLNGELLCFFVLGSTESEARD